MKNWSVCHISSQFLPLTCDAVFALTLHLQRLNIDALIANEAGTGNASIRLAETFFFGSGKTNKLPLGRHYLNKTERR